jgi:hypothetical protein
MAAVSDDLILWHALYGLEVRYWHEVDSNQGANAHAFYTADGVFAVGENEFRGSERIREFYAWRGRRGMETVRSLRTTRHLISNFWVEAAGDREAKAFGVIKLSRRSRASAGARNQSAHPDRRSIQYLPARRGWRLALQVAPASARFHGRRGAAFACRRPNPMTRT